MPTWLYRYFGNWPNIRLYNPSSNPAYAGQVLSEGSGANHGSDLEMVFGNPSGVSGLADTAPEKEMISIMQGAWAAFAKDPVNGLKAYGWPKYVNGKDTLIRLAYNNNPKAEFINGQAYFDGCANYTPTA